jgi:aminoglycoside phosphotransferase (APT) family kinase protein
MSTVDNFQRWMQAELGLTNARVERELSGGNSNLTQLVSTDSRALVLRSAPAATISPKAHLGVQREARFMGALQGTVKVPEVLAWCDSSEVLGYPFAVIEHVSGVSITDTMPAAYDNAESINALGRQLAQSLAGIATAPWQELGLTDMGKPDRFLQRQIERWLDVRRGQPTRDLPEIERLGQWLLDNCPSAGPVGIVHGDFHLDNTLCSESQPDMLAVIDWEMATIGDPLADLGLFLMFWGPRPLEKPGFAHVQAVTRAENVVSRRELAAVWAAASGLDIKQLDYYMCFAFWRLAAIVEGAYGLYLSGKVDTPYARGLEHDVPALLTEAAMAARGEW